MNNNDFLNDESCPGQEQHIGARAPPHELVLENSVLPIGNTGPTFRAQVLYLLCTVFHFIDIFTCTQFRPHHRQ
jgi:hypothetical protein